MKLYPILLSALAIVLLSSCDRTVGSGVPEDLANININIKANYGSEPFVVNEVYDYDGAQIRVQTLQFFLSETSIGTDNDNEEIDEVEYLDFNTLTSQAMAEAGLAIGGGSVPIGDYPGVNLGVGVLPEYNSQTPADFAPSHPLSETGRYWVDWNSFIFLKLEGSMDLDGDGMFDDQNFVYHVGSDPAFEGVEISESISLAKDQSMDLNLILDVEKLFVRDGEHLDIQASPMIHNINQLETGHYLMDNFANALSVE